MKRAIAPGALVWPLRALAFVAMAIIIVRSTPASELLALKFWLGGRVAETHMVPRELGAETFTANGMHAAAVGWLDALLTWRTLHVAGYGALALGGASSLLLALVLTEARSRERGADALSSLGAVVVTALLTVGLWHPGALDLGLPLAALFFLFLERDNGRIPYLCVPLTVLWCNITADGLLAPLFALLALAGAWIDDRSVSARVRRLMLVFAGCAAATLATPAAFALPFHAVSYLGFDPTVRLVDAWQPAAIPVAYRFGFISLVIAACVVGVRRSARTADVLLVATAFALALSNGRFLALSGIAVAPIVAAAARRPTQRGSLRRNGTSAAAMVPGAAAILVAAFVAANAGFASGGATHGPSGAAGAIDRLAHDGRSHRLFCADASVCDFAVAAGSRTLRVFMDGRLAQYPSDVRRDQYIVSALRLGWRRTLERRGIDTIVVGSRERLATVLGLSPGWIPMRAEAAVSVFERARSR